MKRECRAPRLSDVLEPGSSTKSTTKRAKMELRLDTRRGLEAYLVGLCTVLGTDRREIAFHRSVGTGIADLPDLAG